MKSRGRGGSGSHLHIPVIGVLTIRLLSLSRCFSPELSNSQLHMQESIFGPSAVLQQMTSWPRTSKSGARKRREMRESSEVKDTTHRSSPHSLCPARANFNAHLGYRGRKQG
eukprot:767552-Hanusia_phi.AAC.4